ncbi:MAG: L-serine ammonia-lyase, iron-sulfur-dependent subunit beta, partial [Atopobium minutum]|nr:L-serine ammonia-lyase, iron-sulfur-dependent subunit beta [Atopobium minutum]
MMTTSAFEILGPIMVGPSSSHTAGAARLSLVARSLVNAPLKSVRFILHNSFSHTYRGHGSDRALVAGILGLMPDDTRMRNSFALAEEAKVAVEFVEAGDDPGLHPNTVDICMTCTDGNTLEVRGESLGGGRVRLSSINGVEVDLTGDYPTLFVGHWDRPGVLASLTGFFASSKA